MSEMNTKQIIGGADGKTKSKPGSKSKSQSTKSNKFAMDVIRKCIQKHLGHVREEIINILQREYDLKLTDAQGIAERVMVMTEGNMREKYRFKEAPDTMQQFEILLKKKRGITTHQFIVQEKDMIDFINWFYSITSIPFYQSLGDTIGYFNGHWEFNYGLTNPPPEYTNDLIYEFISLGGVNDLSIVNWRASDDTLMYMATFDVLTQGAKTIDEFGSLLRTKYLAIEKQMESRHPGGTVLKALETLKIKKWNEISYDREAKGAGTAMRTGCIGIFFPGKHNRLELIKRSIECSRITHNSTVAMLGGMAAALFTAYAMERVSINKWPHKLLQLLDSNVVDTYMKESRPADYEFYFRDKDLFVDQIKKYVGMRFAGLTPRLDIPILKNPVRRYKYFSENYSKGHEHFAGSCADDAIIMAYDALLESGDNLEKLIVYSILHPGDSDTVGSIAFSWFGAYYHSAKNNNLVEPKFDELEFGEEIGELARHSYNQMIKVYYLDLYFNTALHMLKSLGLHKAKH